MKDNFELVDRDNSTHIVINFKESEPFCLCFTNEDLEYTIMDIDELLFHKFKQYVKDKKQREQINIFRIANKLKEFVEFNRAMKGVKEGFRD